MSALHAPDPQCTDSANDAAADSGEEAMRAQLMPAAQQQAREELIAECRQPGTIAADEWHSYKAEFGQITARDFVALNEEDAGTLFTDRVDAIYEQFVEGMVDQC